MLWNQPEKAERHFDSLALVPYLVEKTGALKYVVMGCILYSYLDVLFENSRLIESHRGYTQYWIVVYRFSF